MRVTSAQLMTAVRVPWTREFTDRITPPAGYTMHLLPHVGCLVLVDDKTAQPVVYVGAAQLRWAEIAPPPALPGRAEQPPTITPPADDEKPRLGRKAV